MHDAHPFVIFPPLNICECGVFELSLYPFGIGIGGGRMNKSMEDTVTFTGGVAAVSAAAASVLVSTAIFFRVF